MGWQIVHNDDVARLQSWCEHLFDPVHREAWLTKPVTIDGAGGVMACHGSMNFVDERPHEPPRSSPNSPFCLLWAGAPDVIFAPMPK